VSSGCERGYSGDGFAFLYGIFGFLSLIRDITQKTLESMAIDHDSGREKIIWIGQY